MSERARWTKLSSQHPFWTVLSEPRYRAEKIGPADVEAFFASGASEVAHTLATVRAKLIPGFKPTSAVDYGCGVGRLSIPLARESDRVVSVDISDPMLEQVRRNAADRGVANIEGVRAEEFMDAPDSRFSFDFVHSYIVLQHIPPATGMRITETMLRRLVPGGAGALHYTFTRRASLLRRVVHPLRIRFGPVNVLANLVQGKPAFEPMIPMHHYDAGRLLELFQRYGCRDVYLELTDQGGHIGAMFFFRKAKPEDGRGFFDAEHFGTGV